MSKESTVATVNRRCWKPQGRATKLFRSPCDYETIELRKTGNGNFPCESCKFLFAIMTRLLSRGVALLVKRNEIKIFGKIFGFDCIFGEASYLEI